MGKKNSKTEFVA